MIFKCKMCGGTLDVKEGQSIAECEFCGTKQTIPVIDNEKSFNLHNRANALRLRNEFDKAIIVYENILTDNPDDAEAHWGLLLCKYGIEYVDDPLTSKKIPTCHRTQFDSVFSDPDYKAAIKNADVLAREVYETEAKEIDGIQKHILEISQKEERFDVFICYKESDETGRRTIDSVIAQDLYSALTQKGYKVFFSKITLETKLGEMYEPYIFAALNSAKVMLVIGTKEAYFNAVWVRNEWSRFIKIMERDHDKYLIPCYKDMDAYDLPMEMASFQAQDMGKIGFLQDLLYGIDKLFGKTARPVKVEEKPTAVIQNGVNYSALLERAQILIEDGDTKKADSLLEKVLNNDPKNAKAYFYKLLIDLNVKSADELNNFTRRISDEPNYIKACRYADAAMKAELDGYSSRIEENVKRQKQEEEYDRCVKLYNEECYLEASLGFNGLDDYKDACLYYARCLAEIGRRNRRRYAAAQTYIKNCEYDKAIEQLTPIKDYNDSAELIEKCTSLVSVEARYREAKRLSYHTGRQSLESAINKFESISGYRDSQRYIDEIAKKLKTKKRNRRIGWIISATVIIAFIVLARFVFIPLEIYNNAMTAFSNGDYYSASALCSKLQSKYYNFGSADKKAIAINTCKKMSQEDKDYKESIRDILGVDGTVTILYDSNGGEEIENEVLHRVSEMEEKEAVKSNKVFYGWLPTDWTVDLEFKKINAKLQLKAVYYGDEYKVTFILNGGEWDYGNSKNYYVGSALTLPSPQKQGYKFVGWSYVLGGDTFFILPVGECGDKKLYANWAANSYTITYNVNGGEIDMYSQKVTYGERIVLPKPTRATTTVNWNFKGWYYNGERITDGIWLIDNDVTLTAKWSSSPILRW